MIFQIIHKLYKRQCLWRIKAEFMQGRMYVEWTCITNVTSRDATTNSRSGTTTKELLKPVCSENTSVRVEIPSGALRQEAAPHPRWALKGQGWVGTSAPRGRPSSSPSPPPNHHHVLCVPNTERVGNPAGEGLESQETGHFSGVSAPRRHLAGAWRVELGTWRPQAGSSVSVL